MKVGFIVHKGVRILNMDYSHSQKEEAAAGFTETMRLAAQEPPESVLGIVDITGTPFDKDIIQQMKEMAAANKPYMKFSTVVGVEGMKKVLFKGILAFSGRSNMVIKDSREKALDFLAALKD